MQQTPFVSSVNSTTEALSGSSSFVGTFQDVSIYDSIVVSCATDQDGILYVDFSPDGTNVDSTLHFGFEAGEVNPPNR